MDLKEKQLAIIQHYGGNKQLDLLVEECSELIQAICKFKRSRMTVEGIEMNYKLAEEMADVENVIDQFKLTNQELATMIDSIKDNKTNRQMHRIEKEGRL